jgi:hypothetical protein
MRKIEPSSQLKPQLRIPREWSKLPREWSKLPREWSKLPHT